MNDDHIIGGIIGLLIGILICGVLGFSLTGLISNSSSDCECEMRMKSAEYKIIGNEVFENKGLLSFKNSFVVEVKNLEDFASKFQVIARCNDKDESKIMKSNEIQIQPGESSEIKLDAGFGLTTEWTCRVTEVKSSSYESCVPVN